MKKPSEQTPDDGGEFDGPIIDIEPPTGGRRRGTRMWVLVALVVLLLFALGRAGSVYMETLWFGSLGYASVYWTGLSTGGPCSPSSPWRRRCCCARVLSTRTRLRRYDARAAARRNQQRAGLRKTRARPEARGVGRLAAAWSDLRRGAGESWQTFALWFNRPQTPGAADPVFGKTLGFYLFTLPALDAVTSWLLALAWVVLVGAAVYSALGLLPSGGGLRAVGSRASAIDSGARKKAYAALSYALAFLLAAMALRAYLSRYGYLFEDHPIFSGVTYTEDQWVLPGLVVVAIALALGAALALANAFAFRRLRPLVAAAALPALVYAVAVMAVPGYVQSFVVKPNELERESAYIAHNIEATRRAFNLERVEARDFPADAADAAYALDGQPPRRSTTFAYGTTARFRTRSVRFRRYGPTTTSTTLTSTATASAARRAKSCSPRASSTLPSSPPRLAATG